MKFTARLLAAIPNGLSVARMVLGISFPWIPAEGRVPAVVVAALSDLLDGALSRWLHVASTTGRILDPVADKVFVLAVVATLVFEGSQEIWEVLLIGLRDLAVLTGAGLVLVRRNWSAFRTMAPSWLGKATTAAQFMFLLTVLICQQIVFVVLLPTAVLSGLAAVDYLRKAWVGRSHSSTGHSTCGDG
jgi:phosphatidylglycerophosphate synthase